jgi:FKBP-type peptidyl-prolyl cis-trans isomerase 2
LNSFHLVLINEAETFFSLLFGTKFGIILSGNQNLRAQKGDTVSVHYVGKYQGGKAFDTSMESEAKKTGLYNRARDYKPLQVKIGAGQVIPGFDEALIGMAINEEKEVTIPPEKGYGKSGRHPMAGKTLVFKLLVTNIKR